VSGGRPEPLPHPPDRAAQVSALVSVLAALAALQMTALVPTAACLLAVPSWRCGWSRP
jgi:hypothetical protein